MSAQKQKYISLITQHNIPLLPTSLFPFKFKEDGERVLPAVHSYIIYYLNYPLNRTFANSSLKIFTIESHSAQQHAMKGY